MIAGTAMAWSEALTHRRQWDRALDAPRFREAFVALAARRKQWPAPSDFIEHLPPRKQLALTKQAIPASPERAAAAISEVAQLLGTRRQGAQS